MLRHYEPPNSERESMRADTEDHIVHHNDQQADPYLTEAERHKLIKKLISLKINELQLFLIYRTLIVISLLMVILLSPETYVMLFGLTFCYIIAAVAYFQLNKKYFTKKTKIEHMMGVLLETFLLSSLGVCSVLKVPYSFCAMALLLDYFMKMYFSCGCNEDVS